MIPAQAVEAGCDALWNAPQGSAAVTDLPDHTMQIILEAAAPHMLAEAFEEAAEAWAEAASWSDSSPSPEQVQRWLRSRANTYRTADGR